jgi:hypothetical protein
LPEIRSWEDYPEFLERVEESLGVHAEELASLTDEELGSALYDFNPNVASVRAAHELKQAMRATSETGIGGARVEWIDVIERYIWRDVKTGRFVSAPSALLD